MNKNHLRLLPALCLTVLVLLLPESRGQDVREKKADAFEHDLVAAGLTKLGLDRGCEIVLADHADLVERTAAEVLQKFLYQGGVEARVVSSPGTPNEKHFWLGRDSTSPEIKRLGDAGKLKIREVSAEDDGFHLKQVGSDVVVAGANPRGVLYGVYAFEDFVEVGADGRLDLRKVPYFRKRGSGPQYSFNPYVSLVTEDFTEEKAIYLSRIGVNQLTDQGIGGTLQDFVDSDVFPFVKSRDDPKGLQPRGSDFRRKVRAMSALCQKYGIDQYVFLSEPALANVGARPEDFPPEALGAVKRPWGGGKDGYDVTLCVSSPIVQKHLQNMMGKFVREYPDIRGVIFYNMDGNTWVCTPELCPRCKLVCTDSPADEYNPWETQANLITLLAAAAHEQDRRFDFRLWGAVHYHGERFAKMVRAAKGYDSLMSCWNASDRSIMVSDAAVRDPAFLITQQVCAERGIPAYVGFEFNNLETVPKSLSFPFHVQDALKKFQDWGVRYVTEIFGVVPEHNPINALAMKEFQWNPDQNPKKILAGLARRQFGEASGKLMYRAWQEMEQGFDSWNDLQFGPLDGSQFYLSIGTTVAMMRQVLPISAEDYGYLGILTKVEPWRAEGYQKFKSQPFAENMDRMSRHFAKAAEYAKQAVDAASDREYIGASYYGGSARPTCREYAELHYASIAIAAALSRQKNDVVRGYHLLTEIDQARASGDAKQAAAKVELHRALVREDIAAQQQFTELLRGFAQLEPTYTRASLTGHEIRDLIVATQGKIDKMEAYLAQKSSDPSASPKAGG